MLLDTYIGEETVMPREQYLDLLAEDFRSELLRHDRELLGHVGFGLGMVDMYVRSYCRESLGPDLGCDPIFEAKCKRRLMAVLMEVVRNL